MDQDEALPFARQTEQAWRELRRQLADHLAALREHESVVLNVSVGGDEADGAPPYVQLLQHGDEGTIRAEAVSDAYLDERRALGETGAAVLAELGWQSPTHGPFERAGGGSANWFLDRGPDRVDELAELAVRTLREAYGCPHPSFLWTEGEFEPTGLAAPLRLDEPDASGPPSDEEPSTMAEAVDRDQVTYPGGPEELTRLLAETLSANEGEAVEADDDGDFPLRRGSTVLFLRVADDEPMIHLFAELVHDLVDREAAHREVNLLNRELLLGSCSVRGDSVRFQSAHLALPFSPLQVRLVVNRITSDLDECADLLAQRTGGLRYLQPAEAEELDLGEPPRHPMVPVLGELLETEAPTPRHVAGLFDGDVVEIAATIAALREEPPSDLDVPEVIATLRQALGYAAHQRADRAFGSRAKPSGRRRTTQQGSLLSAGDGGEPGLDLGLDG